MGVIIHNLFRDDETPMEQRLTNDRRNASIVNRLGQRRLLLRRRQYFVAQLALESTLGSGYTFPTGDLSVVVGGSSTAVESTIPLEPAVRIRITDPTGRLFVCANGMKQNRIVSFCSGEWRTKRPQDPRPCNSLNSNTEHTKIALKRWSHLPHAQRSSTFGVEFVDRDVIRCRRQEPIAIEASNPR